MTKYALVRGGTVVTIVKSNALPTVDLGGQWVACNSQVGPGWTYNGSVFAAPAPGAVRSLPPKQFLARFTAGERELLEEKFLTGSQGVKNKIGAFRIYVLTGGNVELSDDYIIASVTAMETAGVLAAGRAAQILA